MTDTERIVNICCVDRIQNQQIWFWTFLRTEFALYLILICRRWRFGVDVMYHIWLRCYSNNYNNFGFVIKFQAFIVNLIYFNDISFDFL